ncbi:E3 ubiquitin-protein ligase TRIM71 [Pelomyxa schiedti]|nr:E3 ubiquitin-protein ligase TRIM71 [Pelomyxa schiedti]
MTCPCCSSFLHDPRLLPCLHTLCLECLARCIIKCPPDSSPSSTSSSSSSNCLRCPVCHSQAPVPNGGCSGFPVDVWKSNLLGIAPLVGGHAQSPGATATTAAAPAAQECSDCGAHEAPWWCTTCGVFLCNDDKAHHSRARKTASHNVVTLDELGTQTTVALKVHTEPLCSKHPEKKLQLYCWGDNTLICKHCTLIDHKNHDFVFVNDLSSKFKENISSSCHNLALHTEKVTQSRLTAIERCKTTQESTEKFEADIRSGFAKIVALVNARESQLLSELKTATESTKKMFQEHIEECDQKLKVAQEVQEYAHKATTQFSDIELASVNQVLTAQIGKISSSCNSTATPCEQNVRLDFDSAPICVSASSLGRIVPSSTSSSSTITKTLTVTGKRTLTRTTLRQFDPSRPVIPSIRPRPGQIVFVDQATGKVYWDNDFGSCEISEFSNMRNFINNDSPRLIHLTLLYPEMEDSISGTYQAVYKGHLYYNPWLRPTMAKIRLSDGTTVASAPLPNAGHANESSWDFSGGTDICWYVDAGGVLFVVHAPPNNGNIHITRVDPDSLAILRTWVVPRVKKTTGFAFVVKGVFYFGKSYNSRVIDGVFDTTTGVYDDTYRNSLPSSGKYVKLTSWLPSTNQLLVIDLPPEENNQEWRFFIFDNVSV